MCAIALFALYRAQGLNAAKNMQWGHKTGITLKKAGLVAFEVIHSRKMPVIRKISMRLPVVSCCLTLFFAHNVNAMDSSVVRQLDALTPRERLEQRCDIEAMNRIAKDNKQFRPDKVIAYTFGRTSASGNKLSAPGAVFRSREHWYRLKYTCQTGNKQLDVTSFSYQIGAEVPRANWSKYYLYD
jgi:hypothetical protein